MKIPVVEALQCHPCLYEHAALISVFSFLCPGLLYLHWPQRSNLRKEVSPGYSFNEDRQGVNPLLTAWVSALSAFGKGMGMHRGRVWPGVSPYWWKSLSKQWGLSNLSFFRFRRFANKSIWFLLSLLHCIFPHFLILWI